MTLQLRRWRRRGERGAMAVEFTLLVPGLVLMLGLLIAGGRIWFARTAVVDAAQSAARAATIARTAGAASIAGRQAGDRSLATAGLRCTTKSVTIDTAAFDVPVGRAATVRSAVQCRVPFSDILLPGMPGSIQLNGLGAAALDTYRSRS